MSELRSYFEKGLEKLNLTLTEDKIEKIMKYTEMLIETNKHTNLTAIRDNFQLIDKHLLDSMLVQNLIKDDMKSAIDIGTGAGFPGMVLAICNPSINFVLMDSVGRKTKFLEAVVKELNLSNVEVVNERAEDYIKKEGKRETFDLGMCRGVSKLNVILEYVTPFLKVDGMFYALKMKGTNEEEQAKNAFDELSTKILKIEEFELPYSKDKRHIIIMKKFSKTKGKYPRRAGIPLKRPL